MDLLIFWLSWHDNNDVVTLAILPMYVHVWTGESRINGLEKWAWGK